MTEHRVPTAPTWTTPFGVSAPDDLRNVVDLIAHERAARKTLRQAEQEARELIAKAKADEQRQQREADGALWRSYMGYSDGYGDGCYIGCGCDDA